jgi:competence protein ComGC
MSWLSYLIVLVVVVSLLLVTVTRISKKSLNKEPN